MAEDSNGASGAAAMLRRIRELAATVPVVERVHGAARGVETVLLGQLKERLDALDGEASAGHARISAAPAGAGGDAERAAPRDLRARMDALVQRSLEQTPESATEALFGALIDELVPDEARILTAVSDGSQVAFCHLDAAPRIGSAVRVASYLSRIGNECGVMLNDQVPYYLQHLVAMGLLEEGPEDPQLLNTYEMIESGSEVRELSERIGSERKMRPKLSRHTVYLSDFGARFWAACKPD